MRELIEGRGCGLLYLPPYSPDLNPNEEAFSKVKALLRRSGARAREALVGAIGRALDEVTARDACRASSIIAATATYRYTSYDRRWKSFLRPKRVRFLFRGRANREVPSEGCQLSG